MKKLSIISCIVSILWVISAQRSWCQTTNQDDKIVKVALREAANQLLISKGDSTTLIAPVRKLNDDLFELSFGNQISFEPSSLVSAIEEGLQKTSLGSYYTVEVKRCTDREVVYSFLMTNNKETTIVPCLDRPIKTDCYLIEIEFSAAKSTTDRNSITSKQYWIYGLLSFSLLIGFIVYKQRSIPNHTKIDQTKNVLLGQYRFVPQQLKLILEAQEISLSRKECEILQILVDHINEVVTREMLSKRIWEDNGVVVGRSLDTYISKLRKKLQEDKSIKISNIHGVGYKLELLT